IAPPAAAGAQADDQTNGATQQMNGAAEAGEPAPQEETPASGGRFMLLAALLAIAAGLGGMAGALAAYGLSPAEAGSVARTAEIPGLQELQSFKEHLIQVRADI